MIIKHLLGNELIDLKITQSRRRSVSIIVYPNLLVELKAPLRAKEKILFKYLDDRSSWVIKHLEKFKGRAGAAKPKQYVSGEFFSYLGKKYELRVIKGTPAQTMLNSSYLDVFVKSLSPVAVKTALKFWYAERALEVFNERMLDCLEITAFLKLPKHKTLNVKLMKRRWGSCAIGGIITLNPELVAAPLECIDYVIIHELCHLKQHNHSPKFYKLMAAAMPEWKIYKNKLNKETETGFLTSKYN